MIGRERRGENDGTVKAIGASIIGDDESGLMELPTPVGRFRLTKKKISIVVAVGVFAMLLNVQTIEGVEANRCLAILIFSTIMWATEVSTSPAPPRIGCSG
jgi:phosphate transporter